MYSTIYSCGQKGRQDKHTPVYFVYVKFQKLNTSLFSITWYHMRNL